MIQKRRKEPEYVFVPFIELTVQMDIGSLKKQTSHISQRPHSSFRCYKECIVFKYRVELYQKLFRSPFLGLAQEINDA